MNFHSSGLHFGTARETADVVNVFDDDDDVLPLPTTPSAV
jgi:hypothetical protein